MYFQIKQDGTFIFQQFMGSWRMARMNVIRKLLQYLAIGYHFAVWVQILSISYIDNEGIFLKGKRML